MSEPAPYRPGRRILEVARTDPFQCLADHEDLAVETRVEVVPVAVLGVEHDVLVLLDDVDEVQVYTELVRRPQGVIPFRFVAFVVANGVGMSLDAEAGVKIDALDVYSLIEDHLGCQHRVQTAGDQCHRLAL
jgi:Rieske Fe-S protein